MNQRDKPFPAMRRTSPPRSPRRRAARQPSPVGAANVLPETHGTTSLERTVTGTVEGVIATTSTDAPITRAPCPPLQGREHANTAIGRLGDDMGRRWTVMDSDGAGAFDDGTRLMAKRPSRTSTGMSMQWTAEESIPASVNAIPAPTLRRLSRSIAYNLQDSTATQMPPVMGGVGGCDASVNMSHPTVSDGANVTRGTNGSTLLLRNIIGQRRGSFHTQPKSKEFYRVKGLLNSESDPNAVEYVVEKVVTGLLRREDTDTDRMEQDQPLPIETSYFETGLRENVDKSSSNVCIMSEVKNVPPTERFEPLNAFGTCPAIIAPMQIASPLSALPPISMDIGHRFGTSSPPMLISPSLSPGTARGTPNHGTGLASTSIFPPNFSKLKRKLSETGEQIGTGYPLLKRAATTHVQGSDFGQGNFPGAHAPEHLLRIQPPSSQPRPLTNADSALSPITSRVNAKPPQKRSVFLGATVNNSRSMSSRKSLNASRTPSRFSTSPVSPNFASLSAEKDLRQGQVGLPTSAQYDRELEGKYRWRDMRDSDDDDEDDRVR